MDCWISLLGGMLIITGQHARSEELFSYFRMDDDILENHVPQLNRRSTSALRL